MRDIGNTRSKSAAKTLAGRLVFILNEYDHATCIPPENAGKNVIELGMDFLQLLSTDIQMLIRRVSKALTVPAIVWQ